MKSYRKELWFNIPLYLSMMTNQVCIRTIKNGWRGLRINQLQIITIIEQERITVMLI